MLLPSLSKLVKDLVDQSDNVKGMEEDHGLHGDCDRSKAHHLVHFGSLTYLAFIFDDRPNGGAEE